MATNFYLRSNNTAIGGYELSGLERGAAVTTITGTTVSGGTWISLGFWATQPLAPFSLSGTTSFSLRGDESNNTANASFGMRFYKWTRSGGLGASLGQLSATVELLTSESAVTASGTLTTTTFAGGDVLVVEVGIINIGSMGNARTVTLYLDGPTAGASGDSSFTITPNVVLAYRQRTTN